MRRPALFIIIEGVVFLATESANALTSAPIPLSGRIVAALLIAAFVALGFLVPASPRMRTVVLCLNAFLLGLMAAFSGVTVGLVVLLPLRCLELKPGDRRAFAACVAFGLCAFALADITATVLEHRPGAVVAGPILIPLFALLLALVGLSEQLRRSHAALAAANTELTLRAERWQQIATLNERYEIGRDLQDEVGRGLKVISDELERVLGAGATDAQAARAFTFRAQWTAAFTLAGLERTVSGLRDASLKQGNLAASLRDMCKAFSGAHAPQMTVEIADVPVRDPTVAAGLERIAREALINVARHSEASRAKLSFGVVDDDLELLVEDFGIGFRPELVRSGNGLTVIRDRAALIGGRCVIESAPSRGTRVRVTLPLSTVRPS